MTEPTGRGSGSEVSAQQRSTGATSDADVDAAIIQELDRMRNRIQELESQLKQRHAGTTTAADSTKASTATAEQFVSGSDSSSKAAAQTEPPAKPAKAEPFAFADWTWLNGNPRTKEPAFDSKFFTPEVRADVAYHYDFNHPKDDTIGGSSEVFRSNEISLTHLGVGGDFHYDHVRARIFTQLGLYSTATPRND